MHPEEFINNKYILLEPGYTVINRLLNFKIQSI